ncbi:MAG TPA: 2-phospho-L-lactate guanylyltransferase [Thermoleophilaceae bacterium]|nr:2-phospho-L-lactate guanylyltransferase [Thermoleophilaceae bacterium]
MRTIAILPVKSFGAAKNRLAERLAPGSRQAVAQAMFADVLTSLRHVAELAAIAVVTADHTAESAATGHRVQVLHDPEESGQSQAAMVGIRYALASGYERALLVPGDTPLLEAGEVSSLLARAAEAQIAVVVVPDRHGTGTNALLLTPPDAIEPSFGERSLERHVAAAREAGLTCSVDPLPSLVLDVDTPEDLEELSGRLDQRRGPAPVTRGALRQLGRARGERVSA